MAGKKNRTKRTTLRNKADKLFSLYIRQRDGGCVRCLTTEKQLQCAHLISRRYHAVRWDERNAVCLCAGCHRYFTSWPLQWEDFIVARMGEEPYQELRRDAQSSTFKADYEAIIEWLQEVMGEQNDG